MDFVFLNILHMYPVFVYFLSGLIKRQHFEYKCLHSVIGADNVQLEYSDKCH